MGETEVRLPVLPVQEDEHRQFRRPAGAGGPVRPHAPAAAQALGGNLVRGDLSPGDARSRQPVPGARRGRELGVGDRVTSPTAGKRKPVQWIVTALGAQPLPVVGRLGAGALALVDVEVVRAPPVVPQAQRPVPDIRAGYVLHQVALGGPGVTELVGQHLYGAGAGGAAPEERHGDVVVAAQRVRPDERRAGSGHPGPELLGTVRARQGAHGVHEPGQGVRPHRPGRSLRGVLGRHRRDHEKWLRMTRRST